MALTYPIELNLTDRRVVVIGGGTVAARKVAGLVEAGAVVRVVSPKFTADIEQRKDIALDKREYTPDALHPAEMVFSCTDDRELNARIAADARAAGLWCNVADDPELSDFLVPAILRRGELTVAVGTGGASPRLAARLRDRLESNFGPEWAILVEELGRARFIVQDRVADPAVRRRIFDSLCGEQALERIGSADRQAWRRWFEQVLEHHLEQVPGEPEI